MTRGMRLLLPFVINVTIVVMCVQMYLKGYPLPVVATTFVMSVLVGNTVLYLALLIARKRRGMSGHSNP